MSAGPLLDQERVRGMLERTLAGGELPPAYLFAGPHGVGKEEAALALAQALNCSSGESEAAHDLFGAVQPDDTRPSAFRQTLGGCGTCSACTRIARYGHPDVMVRMPLPRPRGSKSGSAADPSDALAFKADNPYRDPEISESTRSLSIGIADVREIIQQLAYAPVEGGERVVIFREAERMTEEAQNALLKSMEEPPHHTLFILTTHRPAALLPTVRSRCRTIFFRPLPAEVVARFLNKEGVAPGKEMDVARLSRGSLKRAFDIAEGGVPGREEAIRVLSWAVESRRREALAWAAGFTFKSSGITLLEARTVIDELLTLTRDVAAIQSGDTEKLMNPDMADMLLDVGRKAPQGAGLKALEAVADAWGEVDSNVNLALIYASLFNALAPLGIH